MLTNRIPFSKAPLREQIKPWGLLLPYHVWYQVVLSQRMDDLLMAIQDCHKSMMPVPSEWESERMKLAEELERISKFNEGAKAYVYN